MKTKKNSMPLNLIFAVAAIVVIGVILYLLPQLTQEPEPYDYECNNIKIFDVVTEDILSAPATDKPTIRIFDRGIERCKNSCIYMRNYFGENFDAEFECVPVQKVDEEYLASVYSFIQSGYEEPTDNSNSIIYSSYISVGNIGGNPSEIMETLAKTPLKDMTVTVYFRGGEIFYSLGLPLEEDICSFFNYEMC